MSKLEQIKSLLEECTKEQRLEVFNVLRKEFPIHALEEKLNAKAEVILEAFSKASDLTMRGLRGIIAEACFVVDVVSGLPGWKDVTPAGDFPYDCLLEDRTGQVRVQIKMQRMKQRRPMMAQEAYRFFPAGMPVAETQRTRGGTDAKGEKTRPYRFGEFDILGVCLHPSTGKWTDFVYTVANWLIPDPQAERYMLKFQPVSAREDEDWTKDFLKSVEWFRSGVRKQICSGQIKLPASRKNV
jgi:hypothetical protein